MRRRLSLLLCLCAMTLWAQIPTDYYAAANGKSSSEALLDALNTCIKNHTSIGYSSLENYYEDIDFREDGTLWDIYSTCTFTMDDANKPQSSVCDGWNKEHMVPQSWFNKTAPMKSDLFHVIPTDARVNNFRSNYPYGEVSGANGTGITNNTGNHALGKVGTNTFTGYSGKVFEPHDDYKGDIARTYFYMVARYRDVNFTSSGGSAVFTSNKTNLTSYAISLFLKWHRQDPVSDKEVKRNNAVYAVQKNRNPFIDYPELAEYIWGTKQGQTLDLTTMTPTTEGGQITPPVPVTRYGITWSVNGEVLMIDSIAEGQSISALPATPASCSESSETFVGWTTEPIHTPTNTAPVLYANAKGMPLVTSDATYYAVFAHVERGEVLEPAIYSITYNTTPDGWTNTAADKNGSYWLLDKGREIISPEVNLAGLSTIAVRMRTYGGTQNCNLDVTANGQQIATLVATNGKTMTDYEWTNTTQLTGTAPLTFSTNYSTNNGVGILSITINATRENSTFSAYRTHCSEGTGFDQAQRDQVSYTKILQNGQIYILIDEQLYNIMGQRIR